MNSKSKYKKEKCNECNKRRKISNENHQICYVCYETRAITYKPSGNKIIDDFIRYTQTSFTKNEGKMEFVPYEQFVNVEFIAEGCFSKIYKAIWVDGPILNWNYENQLRKPNYSVVLKKLDNSKNVTQKNLNELKNFYMFSSSYKGKGHESNINKYFGITQDPITKDIIIIMPYYASGDLLHYITNDFYNISWEMKLSILKQITNGLKNLHNVNIIHRDFNSSSIFFNHDDNIVVIGSLSESKSAVDCNIDDDNENYGIIPYMAPEIFQGQKYTTASDIYSFGMIMWELMTGRRPFWNKIHNVELIIEICDGLRPPIVTNAPEGYIELMKECWDSDPTKRPTTIEIYNKVKNMEINEQKNNENKNPTKIIKSPDIGPVTINNNPDVNLKIDQFYDQKIDNTDKRKFENDLIEDCIDNNDQNIKRRKSSENENYEDLEEIEFDI